jgi:glycosyltransferase involved in cell wall biosynthesis
VRKPRVLFVANVMPGPDGATGGQVVAASTLFRSRLAEAMTLELIAVPTQSVPPPSLPMRFVRALSRFTQFTARLRAADAVLVFAADAVSLVEKGSMCIIARLAGRGVVLRTGGGNLAAQCDGSRLARAWLRLVLRSVHLLCTQSPHWTTYFNRYREARHKVIEVSNGLVLGPAPTGAPRRSDARLAFVGWVTREKGIFEALEVLDRLRQQHPAATLTVAGGGRDLGAFLAAASARGLIQAVNMRGWIDGEEVRRMLRDCDVFLFPSHCEGLPNALIEAMAAGLPAVATRVGGVPDLIQDGENGFVVDVADVDRMTALVGDLVACPERAQKIGLRARQTAEDRCDIERVWPRYAEAIHQAVARAGAILER